MRRARKITNTSTDVDTDVDTNAGAAMTESTTTEITATDIAVETMTAIPTDGTTTAIANACISGIRNARIVTICPQVLPDATDYRRASKGNSCFAENFRRDYAGEWSLSRKVLNAICLRRRLIAST